MARSLTAGIAKSLSCGGGGGHWRIVARTLFLACAFALSACGEPPVTSRVKLTVYVDTPKGPVISSGVTAETDGLPSLWESIWHLGLRKTYVGEAQVVDLGAGGKLFILPLTPDFARRDSAAPMRVIAFLLHHQVWGEAGVTLEGERQLNSAIGLTEVPSRMLPMIVRFRNIDDPASVETVDPGDLSRSFGPGYQLTRATIEMTSDPVTHGAVEAALPHWFEELRDQHASLDGDASTLRHLPAPLANRLNARSFVIPPDGRWR
jgi:hypothetical protein